MITCACLLLVKKDALFLTRHRDHNVWYLPGGKIDPGESPKDALIRELSEELGAVFKPQDLTFSGVITGPSHDHTSRVELICFSGPNKVDQFTPQNEVIDAQWIPFAQRQLIAPALLE